MQGNGSAVLECCFCCAEWSLLTTKVTGLNLLFRQLKNVQLGKKSL